MVLDIDKWLLFCAREYTNRTCGGYRSYIKVFDAWLAKNGGELTTDAINSYIDGLLLTGTKKRTVNVQLTVIKSYCKWYARTFKKENPAQCIKMVKQDPPDQRIVTEEEYAKVLAVAEGQERDIVVFIGNTGLRVHEFNSLRWSNVNPDFKFLSVVGKKRKVRIVPLNPTCQEILRRYKASDTSDGKLPFTRSTRFQVWSMCQRLAKKAGIPHFGPHALRHRFATLLMRQDISDYKISRALGHASPAITEEVYIHFRQQDIYGITDCIPN